MRTFYRHIPPAILLLMVFGLAAGCSSLSFVPFTQATQSDYGLSAPDLENLQIYNSHTIILTGENMDRESTESKRSGMILKDATFIDKIVIKPQTPGIVVRSTEFWLEVSFEADRILRFELMNTGQYALNTTRVLYGDLYYRVECIHEKSSRCPPILLYRGEIQKKIKTKTRKARGQRIKK